MYLWYGYMYIIVITIYSVFIYTCIYTAVFIVKDRSENPHSTIRLTFPSPWWFCQRSTKQKERTKSRTSVVLLTPYKKHTNNKHKKCWVRKTKKNNNTYQDKQHPSPFSCWSCPTRSTRCSFSPPSNGCFFAFAVAIVPPYWFSHNGFSKIFEHPTTVLEQCFVVLPVLLLFQLLAPRH